MEGFEQTIEKKRPTDEPKAELGVEGKTRESEISVAGMFNEHMETTGIIKRITEDPYFMNLSERN
jgi:hypothetical protein